MNKTIDDELLKSLTNYFVNGEFKGKYAQPLVDALKKKLYKYKPIETMVPIHLFEVHFNENDALLWVQTNDKKYKNAYYTSQNMEDIVNKIVRIFHDFDYDFTDFDLTEEHKYKDFKLDETETFDNIEFELFVNGFCPDFFEREKINQEKFDDFINHIRDKMFISI